jgi:hypothetical protein
VSRRLTLLLALLALAAPVAAYAGASLSHPGDQASVAQAGGCQVTRNADHSITVHCPAGHWAELHWSFRAHAATTATVTCREHRCRYTPTIKATRQDLLTAYTVTERVHSNTITSAHLNLG